MSIIAKQVTLERGLRAEFQQALMLDVDPLLNSLFMFINSNGSDEKYGWLGNAPQMTEWVDERNVRAVNDFDFTIANRAYEATIGV